MEGYHLVKQGCYLVELGQCHGTIKVHQQNYLVTAHDEEGPAEDEGLLALAERVTLPILPLGRPLLLSFFLAAASFFCL